MNELLARALLSLALALQLGYVGLWIAGRSRGLGWLRGRRVLGVVLFGGGCGLVAGLALRDHILMLGQVAASVVLLLSRPGHESP